VRAVVALLVMQVMAVKAGLLVKLVLQLMDKQKQAVLVAVVVVDVVSLTVVALVVVDQMFMAHFHHIAIPLELVAV
jgi:hypothetical protein